MARHPTAKGTLGECEEALGPEGCTVGAGSRILGGHNNRHNLWASGQASSQHRHSQSFRRGSYGLLWGIEMFMAKSRPAFKAADVEAPQKRRATSHCRSILLKKPIHLQSLIVFRF